MRFFNETRQIPWFCRLFHGESQGCAGERTLLAVRPPFKSRNRKISTDGCRVLADMGPSPDKFPAVVGSTCHSPTCSPRQKKGEVVLGAWCDASITSINPYFHPSRTGIEGLRFDKRKSWAHVEIKAYAGEPVVASPVQLLTGGCPYPCKVTRKRYGRMHSAR